VNIFYLDPNPRVCAEMHLDKHVVKMIIEYAQLMSTAHRFCDGTEYFDLTANGRKIKRWRLNDEREAKLMKASHINHPSAVWLRHSKENYAWLYEMWVYLLQEYTFRYGKIHACARLFDILAEIPHALQSKAFTEPTPAMPVECKVFKEVHTDRFEIDSLASYHKYYLEKKKHFARWTKREIPLWYSKVINTNNANL
jgi:hypothetical protein